MAQPVIMDSTGCICVQYCTCNVQYIVLYTVHLYDARFGGGKVEEAFCFSSLYTVPYNVYSKVQSRLDGNLWYQGESNSVYGAGFTAIGPGFDFQRVFLENYGKNL